jgi:hypothetical protein
MIPYPHDCRAWTNSRRRPGIDRCGSLLSLRTGKSPGFGRFDLPGRLPLPRQQCLEFVPFGAPGYDAFKYIGEPASGSTPFNFALWTRVAMIAQCSPPLSGPGHSARFLTFEAVVTYPFHPMAGQTVLVIGDHEHDGIHHLMIRQANGGSYQVPDWMSIRRQAASQ